MFGLFSRRFSPESGLLDSKLFDDQTFYQQFLADLGHCKNEVIIESPFITSSRVSMLIPIIKRLTSQATRVTINTRDPIEHESPYDHQAKNAIACLQSIGAQVLFTGGLHRKLAILDRKILWEGSLNILSQNDSCEIMRRTRSTKMAQQMIGFAGLKDFLK